MFGRSIGIEIHGQYTTMFFDLQYLLFVKRNLFQVKFSDICPLKGQIS